METININDKLVFGKELYNEYDNSLKNDEDFTPIFDKISKKIKISDYFNMFLKKVEKFKNKETKIKLKFGENYNNFFYPDCLDVEDGDFGTTLEIISEECDYMYKPTCFKLISCCNIIDVHEDDFKLILKQFMIFYLKYLDSWKFVRFDEIDDFQNFKFYKNYKDYFLIIEQELYDEEFIICFESVYNILKCFIDTPYDKIFKSNDIKKFKENSFYDAHKKI